MIDNMNIAVQMYSLRHFIAKEGLDKALHLVADCGFDSIEPICDDYGIGFAGVAERMRAYGLQATSAHVANDVFRDSEKLAAFADAFRLQTAVIPWMASEDFCNDERLHQTLEKQIANANALGLEIAYHNHAHELAEKGALSSLPDRFPPLKLQPDIFWLKAAGIEPIDFLRENAEKIALVHLKEFGSSVEEPNPVVGNGTTDAKEVLAFAISQKHKSIVLEYENVENDQTYLQKSIAFIRENLHE